MTRICLECINCTGSSQRCRAPESHGMNHVTGEIWTTDCAYERRSEYKRNCGVEGKFWKPNLRYKIKTYIKQLFKSWSDMCFRR